ncbi:MAG TPA: succinate dehydrogenase assembly factor 2 [Kiloniellales bacterium]|nr:succinate dehydrogenase assembly factor 2 [Kiloniellales bacterium]
MSESLTIRRKRLRFRSWHRGTREIDLLLGGFADRALATMDAADLDRYEALLEVPDPQLYAWVTGRESPPPEYDHEITRALIAYRPQTVRP